MATVTRESKSNNSQKGPSACKFMPTFLFHTPSTPNQEVYQKLMLTRETMVWGGRASYSD